MFPPTSPQTLLLHRNPQNTSDFKSSFCIETMWFTHPYCWQHMWWSKLQKITLTFTWAYCGGTTPIKSKLCFLYSKISITTNINKSIENIWKLAYNANLLSWELCYWRRLPLCCSPPPCCQVTGPLTPQRETKWAPPHLGRPTAMAYDPECCSELLPPLGPSAPMSRSWWSCPGFLRE